MSITINGATNTLTAASGLTVAGNTAVTGTLSATGTVTAVTDLQLGRATGSLNLPVIRFTSSATAPFVAAKGDNIVVGCQGSGEVYIAVEDVTKATISATGLAVTGTLSATGLGGAAVELENNIVYIRNSTATAAGAVYFQRADETSKAFIGSYFNTADEGNLEFGNSGTTYMRLGSAGGLAVTGALSATGLISKTNSPATLSQFFGASGSTTAPTYGLATNTGGGLAWGIEGSVDNAICTGSTAYAGLLYTTTSNPLQLGVNSVIKATLSSTALTLGTGVNLVTTPAAATNTNFLASATSTTGGNYLSITNSGGTAYLGVDSSTANVFANGNYTTVLGAAAAIGGVLRSNTGVASLSWTSTAVTIGTGVNLVMSSATTMRLGGYTVATLPAAGTAGRTAYVTDATAPTYLGALTGGGAVVCPVFDNGVAWVSA